MADNFAQQRAEAQFRRMQRAEDGKKAMSEYEAEAAAVRAKTARLRELRLAKDAAEKAAASAPSSPAKKGARKSKSAAPTIE